MEKKSSDKSVRWLCGILFAAFAFCWLFFFQRELLWAENRVLFSADNGLRIWMFDHHLLVSVALTVIALLFALPGKIVLRFKKGLYACNYLFSAAFLGVITGYDGDSLFCQSYSVWIVTGVFMVVLFLVCKIVASVPKSEYNDRPRTLAGNFLILSLLFCITSFLGNTDENLHRRLKMENLYEQGKYEDLLGYGRYEEESDSDIDLLRAQAMLALEAAPKGSAIGDMLFRYSIYDSKTLARSLSGMDNTQAYLSACLLTRDLESFRDSIHLEDYKELPTYYLQALVLANDSLASVRFADQFNGERARLESFQSKLEPLKSESRQFQANSTYINFRETYFWFYTFGLVF